MKNSIIYSWNIRRSFVFTLILLFTQLSNAQLKNNDVTNFIFQDSRYSFAQRAADLVSRMTLDEKCSQMCAAAVAIPRLNIPAYNWWSEGIHGVDRAGKATIFPQVIGLGATFDRNLIYRVADAISDEARLTYVLAKERGTEGNKYVGLTYWAPNINIFRDPRWGRGQETYGEDPFLTGELGESYINGLQGNDKKYLKVAACVKHFAVHSGPESLRHGFNAIVSWKDLHETYLPAFKKLVEDAHVEGVMGAYNRTNGEVCCGSKTFLRDILRNQWGFKGYIVSDCGAIGNFVNDHKVCKTPEEAAALAANNTTNLNCGWVYKVALAKAVRQGLIKEATIDSLVSTLMITKLKLGLFDDYKSNPYNRVSPDIVDSKEHRDLAYESAVKSMLLLENKRNTLPISSKRNYVYVTGPLANTADALIGNYYGANDKMSNYYEGITGALPKGMTIQYRTGVSLNEYGYNDWTVREAPEADIVVACMGLSNMLEGEETDAILSETKGDAANLQLPEAQMKFLRNLRENIDKKNEKEHADTRLVVVISSGAPLILTEISKLADALVYAWYPGQAGGNALGDLLFGKVSFSGKSPMTFVKSLEQLPDFQSYDMQGRTYKYFKKEPQYPFGYGLSYTTFSYSDLKLPNEIKAGESIDVSVKVTNTGNMSADEVAQVYISGGKSWSVDNPIRRLAGFERVSLYPGESKILTIRVNPESMSILTSNERRIVKQGLYKISIGGGQPVKSTSSFLIGDFKIKGNKNIEL